MEFLSPFFCPVRPIRIAMDENEPADACGSWFLNCLVELICGIPEKSRPLFSVGIPLALRWWPASECCLFFRFHLNRSSIAKRIRATPTTDERTAISILIGNLIPVEGVPAAGPVGVAAEADDAVGLRSTDVGFESIPILITKLAIAQVIGMRTGFHVSLLPLLCGRFRYQLSGRIHPTILFRRKHAQHIVLISAGDDYESILISSY